MKADVKKCNTDEIKITGDENSWYENDVKLDCDTDTTVPSLFSIVKWSIQDELGTELRRKEAE